MMPHLIAHRLLADPLFGALPASLLGAWLAGAGKRRVEAGQCWDAGLASGHIAVFIPDAPALALAQRGMGELLGRPALPDQEQSGAAGWLLELPCAALREAMAHDAAIGVGLAAGLDAPLSAANQPAFEGVRVPEARKRAFGWLGVLVLPTTAFAGLPLLGLSADASAFAAAVLAGLWIWLRQLAPPFVGALLILAILVLSTAVPVSVAFGGFADSGIFLLLGILSLGYLIGSSGLAERLTRALLKRLPPTARGYHLGLFSLGALLTLILPSGAVRIQIVSAIIARLGPSQKPGQKEGAPTTHLAVAALTGVSALSTVFLTSNAVNFMVLGMLPPEWRQHFGWVAWFEAAAGFMLPFLAGYLLFFWLVTRRAAYTSVHSGNVGAPAWRPDERAAASAIGLFALGAATASLHHVAVPLMALAVYLWLFGLGMLSDKAATPQVNWPMVLYLSAMIGLVRSFDTLQLETELSGALTWLPALAARDPALFLLVLIGTTALLRLMLPAMACISVLCIMLIPLTSGSPVNPWLIVFIVTTVSEGWFFPHQSSDYQLFRTGVGEALDGQEAQFLKLNAIVQLLRLLALALAIPYWDAMGLL